MTEPEATLAQIALVTPELPPWPASNADVRTRVGGFRLVVRGAGE
ncbi:hypothetical protein [Actinokineospora inagensis]|nr:hypothetical protein [Actinokineospora inagensis]